MNLRVLSDPSGLADAAADEIARWLAADDAPIGLSGGSTPVTTYERLTRREVRWHGVAAWMTDERHVPLDHPDSNAGAAGRALFDSVPATLHAVPWDESAHAAAIAYESTLLQILPGDALGPEPGLVMLGLGDDGHTASLFPGSSALEEDERWFVATDVAGKGWRLTATLGLLARARRTLFLVTGEHKAEVVAEIMSGGSDLPAAVVARHSRDPVWLLDRAAASRLD